MATKSKAKAKAPKKAVKKAAQKAKAKAPKKVVKAAPKAKAPVKVAVAAKFVNAFNRWKKKEQISVLAAELGVRRGALRRQFRKLAGGKDAFKSLRAEGAGGLRASLGERAKSPDQDAKALVIPVGGRTHWYHRWCKDKEGTPFAVHVAGGGVEYRTANSDEKADAIAMLGNGLPHARLVRFNG